MNEKFSELRGYPWLDLQAWNPVPAERQCVPDDPYAQGTFNIYFNETAMTRLPDILPFNGQLGQYLCLIIRYLSVDNPHAVSAIVLHLSQSESAIAEVFPSHRRCEGYRLSLLVKRCQKSVDNSRGLEVPAPTRSFEEIPYIMKVRRIKALSLHIFFYYHQSSTGWKRYPGAL